MFVSSRVRKCVHLCLTIAQKKHNHQNVTWTFWSQIKFTSWAYLLVLHLKLNKKILPNTNTLDTHMLTSNTNFKGHSSDSPLRHTVLALIYIFAFELCWERVWCIKMDSMSWTNNWIGELKEIESTMSCNYNECTLIK